jgi:hypothetical protein
MRILPPKQELIQLLGRSDFFLWEYYGEGVLSKIQAWIFGSHIEVRELAAEFGLEVRGCLGLLAEAARRELISVKEAKRDAKRLIEEGSRARGL